MPKLLHPSYTVFVTPFELSRLRSYAYVTLSELLRPSYAVWVTTAALLYPSSISYYIYSRITYLPSLNCTYNTAAAANPTRTGTIATLFTTAAPVDVAPGDPPVRVVFTLLVTDPPEGTGFPLTLFPLTSS